MRFGIVATIAQGIRLSVKYQKYSGGLAGLNQWQVNFRFSIGTGFKSVDIRDHANNLAPLGRFASRRADSLLPITSTEPNTLRANASFPHPAPRKELSDPAPYFIAPRTRVMPSNICSNLEISRSQCLAPPAVSLYIRTRPLVKEMPHSAFTRSAFRSRCRAG